MSPATGNRRLHPGLVLLFGTAIGAVCYLLAESLTPKDVASAGDHDVLLANRLGFIFAPVVGIWLGWLQRSWKRAIGGALLGVCIGVAYMWLCSTRNFLAIMVGFPCLLGGVLAAIASSNRSPWLIELAPRLFKGLLAGLVLGFVYMVVLNVAGGMVMTPNDEAADHTEYYIKMMWRAGPIALALASGLFFVAIQWAVGLTRVRLLVFEDVKISPSGTAPDTLR